MRSRLVTAVVGIAASLVVTAALWYVFDQPFLLLVVPLIPFLFWRRDGAERPPARECPRCGFRTRDPEVQYCPRDGSALE